METNFKSVHTPKDIIISTVVILAGVGSYFLNPALGVTLASCGLLMLCFFKKGYKADGKEQVLTKVAMDMSASYLQPLKDFLGGKSIDLNLGEAARAVRCAWKFILIRLRNSLMLSSIHFRIILMSRRSAL